MGEDGNALVSNRYGWTKETNLLFVDQPASVGFSYVDDKMLTLALYQAPLWSKLSTYISSCTSPQAMRFSHHRSRYPTCPVRVMPATTFPLSLHRQ